MEEDFFRKVLHQFQGFFKEMNDLCVEEMKKNNVPIANKSLSHPVKQKKDPDAPKKPRSGYIYFCMHVRTKYPDKLKDVPLMQQSSILGKEWAKLAQAKKDYFNALGEKDKSRYDQEQADYEKKKGIISKVSKTEVKQKKATPKQPVQIEQSDEEQEIQEEQVIEEQEESPEVVVEKKKKIKK